MQNLTFKARGESFSLTYAGLTLIEHSPEQPCLVIGRGEPDIEMFHGNFSIQDKLIEKIPLTAFSCREEPDHLTITLSRGQEFAAYIEARCDAEGRLKLTARALTPGCNRLTLRLAAEKSEHVYGLGEQFSYFDLRGRAYPLWTSEQGVGRNKKSLVTFMADCNDNAGGDYYWTFFPEPTFVSSRHYYCHSDSSCYMNFDFSKADCHELTFWQAETTLTLECAPTFIELVQKITALLGRQPELPEWVYDGIILGIQGGTAVCDAKVKAMQKAGVKVAGIWAQDWSGIRMTSFGKRVMWNWEYSDELYPNLPEQIKKWSAQGVQFLAYINPYLAADKNLCQEASRRGLLAKIASGEDYLVDFGEFSGGVVDFTNPEAFHWFKELIKHNLIDLGIKGWMADFGEYLPTDAVLYQGDALIEHNKWPARWARCNYEALNETGELGKTLFFMRAGFSSSQRWSVLMWAGDQNVDWSLDDSLASVMPAALSLALCGHGLHHSDIGGYTTLYGMHRTKELLLRWCDFCAFTPLMRTHEGNRPLDNWQFDSDAETMAHFARMVGVHTVLKPYLKDLVKINAASGIPVMRPLLMHYEADPKVYTIGYQYLLGPDLLVAPVYEEGKASWSLYLPDDEWIGLWDGKAYAPGEHEVEAPLGKPPVFYRKGSAYAALFAGFKDL